MEELLIEEQEKLKEDKEVFINSLSSEQKMYYSNYLIRKAKVIQIEQSIKNKQSW